MMYSARVFNCLAVVVAPLVCHIRIRMASHTRYIIESCPLSDECSAASWKKMRKCQSWISPADAREKLLKDHLEASSLHYNSHNRDELRNLAEWSEVNEEEVDAQWFCKAEDVEPKRKKASQRDEKEDERIAVIAVKATKAMLETVAAASSTSTVGVRAPANVLKQHIEDLEKTALIAERAIEVFRNATAAFEEQSVTLLHMAGDLRQLL